MYRTHTCGELTKEDVGKTVQLSGWVNSTRDHGGLIFIDLRDRYGIIQCTFDPKKHKEAWKIAETARAEWVIQVEGEVKERPDEMINPNIKTGEVEICAGSVNVLTKSKTPPFEIEWHPYNIDESKTGLAKEKHSVSEELRLKYRYLDLRTKRMAGNIKLRSRLIHLFRKHLTKMNFMEIETPILTKSTPEGARDYIVPSRVHSGEFYALPQSPQQYKQLLMIAGMDKYFQIARCFRDEDQRGDRQPEFTQLDIEMSFVEADDVTNLTENLFKTVFKQLSEEGLMDKKIVLDKPWPKIEYNKAIIKYGIDRPDIRFGLPIVSLSKVLKNTDFQVFSAPLKEGGTVRAISAIGAAHTFTRKDIDELTNLVKKLGAKGLAYIRIKNKEEEKGETAAKTQEKDTSTDKEIILNNKKLILNSPIIKFLKETEILNLLDRMETGAGDIIFFGAGPKSLVSETLAELRVELGKRLKLIDKNLLAPCWIVDFPMFVGEQEGGGLEPSHHMFTAPKPEDLHLLDTNPTKAKCTQYDLVINGYEVGGGSIRIHDPKIQEKVFELVGFDEKKKKEFSHILEAFKLGVPPHGGIAPGLDRIAMLLAGESNIREVMAFPKNQQAQDIMMNAPSRVDKKQLNEVHIKTI